MNELVRQLRKQKYTVELRKGSSHYHVRAEGVPSFVVMASTPSNQRGIKNAKATLRRVLGADV